MYQKTIDDWKEAKTIMDHNHPRAQKIHRSIFERIVLDLADYAKRESRFKEAKLLFKLVSYLQPYAY